MASFIEPIRDLFDIAETVHRVPVYLGADKDRFVGVAYASEDDVIIHVKSEQLKREIGTLLEINGIQSFIICMEYKPAQSADEDILTPDEWMNKLRRCWNYNDPENRINEKMSLASFLEYMGTHGHEMFPPASAWDRGING